MAKKQSSIARFTKAVANRKRKNPEGAIAKLTDDALHVAGSGVVAYALTRVAGRIAYRLARKRSTRLARHAGAIVPSFVALGTYALTSSIESLKEYRAGAVAGSSAAAVQSVLQTYVPRYGWFLNDYHMDDVLPAMQQTQSPQLAVQQTPSALPEPTNTVANVDASGEIDLSDIADGIGDDDDFLDQLEDQASGKVISFPAA